MFFLGCQDQIVRWWRAEVTIWNFNRFDFIGSGSLPLILILVKVVCDFKGLIVYCQVLTD